MSQESSDALASHLKQYYSAVSCVWTMQTVHYCSLLLVLDMNDAEGTLQYRGYPTVPYVCLCTWTMQSVLKAVTRGVESMKAPTQGAARKIISCN